MSRSTELSSGIVRVRMDAAPGGGAGGVVGAGFLITSDMVCTCAHVVLDALLLDGSHIEEPDAPILLDFPFVPDVPAVRARVAVWKPVLPDGRGDVALLKLERPILAASPVTLVDGSEVWGHEFRVYGFPNGADDGIWVSGTLRDKQGTGWLQMDARSDGPRIEPGFSGSPVWDASQGGIVGMTVTAGKGRFQGTAYLLPSLTLLGEAPLDLRCPFLGLEPFQEEDSTHFFGRENDVARLLDSITHRPVTLVAGPSGSGKSSLVRAGLLPFLRERGFAVSVLRPTAGTRPEAALAQVIAPLLGGGGDTLHELHAIEELTRLLRRPDEGPGMSGIETVAWLSERIAGDPAMAGPRLLFTDQLEEYTGEDPAGARRLFELLVALSASSKGPTSGGSIRVVATVRPESLDALVTEQTSITVSDAVLFIAPLASEGLLRAVTEPVRATPGVWFEEGLPERIVQDAGDEPGRMPLVEFTLTQLWDLRRQLTLTHAAYQELGGVAGALVRYAEGQFVTHQGRFGESAARRLFVQLARPDDHGGYARRAVRLADLDPEAQGLVRAFATGKLLVLGQTPGPDPDEIVDLAHEALTNLWPRLRGWLDDSRKFRHWQEQLRRDIAQWERHDRERKSLLSGRPLATAADWLEHRLEDLSPAERKYIEAGVRYERRGIRIRNAAVLVLVVLFLGTALMAGVARQKSSEATHRARIAASQAMAARSNDLTETDPRLAAQLAVYAYAAEPTIEAKQALARAVAANGHVERFVQGGSGEAANYVGSSGGPTNQVALSGDGSILAYLSDFRPGQVHFYDVKKGQELPGLPTGDWPHGGGNLELSSDGRILAMELSLNRIAVWDVHKRKTIRTFSAGNTDQLSNSQLDLRAFAFSADGRWLSATYYTSGVERLEIAIWNVVSGEILSQGPAPSEQIQLEFDRDNAHLLCLDAEKGAVRRLALKSGDWQPVRRMSDLAAHDAAPPVLSADGRVLAKGSELWDINTGKRISRPTDTDLSPAVFPADQHDLVIAAVDGQVSAYDSSLARKTLLGSFTWPVANLSVSTDGRWVAATSADGAVSLFNLREPSAVAPVPAQKELGRGELLLEGDYVVRKNGEKSFEVWAPKSGSPTLVQLGVIPRAFDVNSNAVAVTSDNSKAVLLESTGDRPAEFELRDPRTGRVISTHSSTQFGTLDSDPGIHFLSDDVHLVASNSQGIALIDTRNWQTVTIPVKGVQGTVALDVSADGSTVTHWSSNSDTVRVYRYSTGTLREVRTLSLPPFTEVHLTVSQHGEKIAAIDRDGHLTVIDVTTGRSVHGNRDGSRWAPDTATFSGDASLVIQPVEVNGKSVIRFWDSGTGDQLEDWDLPAQIGPSSWLQRASTFQGDKVLIWGPSGAIGVADMGLTAWRDKLCRLLDAPLPKVEFDRYLDGLGVASPCPAGGGKQTPTAR
ncbi:trypsin-like peptidase domain-containing protein [Streptomyces sp. NPDC001822]|uniref:nSTAND1 domain-containing NTPase n=1 Tax=Streptomyces sp. NPDC001822 TaxID=3364614 RepID=UPI003684C4D4